VLVQYSFALFFLLPFLTRIIIFLKKQKKIAFIFQTLISLQGVKILLVKNPILLYHI